MPEPTLAWSVTCAQFISDSTQAIIYGCVILMVVVIAGFVAVSWVRKWSKSTPEVPAGGFSLSDLRALHKQGKISNEEFEKTRAMIVAAAKKASEKKDPIPPPMM